MPTPVYDLGKQGAQTNINTGDPSIDPATGKPWANQSAYDSWKQGATGSGSNWNIDWSKTGSQWEPGLAHGGASGAETNPGVLTEDTVGYYGGVGDYKAKPGDYAFRYGSLSDPSGESYGGGVAYLDPYSGKYYAGSQEFNYDPSYDYGLGSKYVGVMPTDRNSSGQVTGFYAMTAGGGGQVFSSADEAKAAADEYTAWRDEQSRKGARGGSDGDGTAPLATNGDLTKPGANETFYDKTKGFYTGETNAQKAWEETANQPPMAVQNFNAQSGRFNQPTASEDLYSRYKDQFSDPGYLDDFYDRERKKSETALAARASSGGWGGSGAWARATGNIGQEFADKALLARENFIKTGMGAAGASDASVDSRLGMSNTMATSADKSLYDKLVSAGIVDKGLLDRISAGTSASSVAQSHLEGREDKGLDTQIEIAKDMANLTMQGLSNAQAQDFTTFMEGLSLDAQSGKLSYDQANAQAKEFLQGLGVVMNATLQGTINSKLGKK